MPTNPLYRALFVLAGVAAAFIGVRELTRPEPKIEVPTKVSAPAAPTVSIPSDGDYILSVTVGDDQVVNTRPTKLAAGEYSVEITPVARSKPAPSSE